uniref:Reverse transcriptase domain-containing protein n=1 Tax=Monopterus albus TaxID=43700 RepID=A0A3Q3ILI4_MONAL
LMEDYGVHLILALLDLSAGFDTVDHAVLLSTLEHLVGLGGMVLNWFSSFLRNRTISVIIDDFSSDTAHLTSGIPQGSTLAPLLFSLYMSPLALIISRHNVHFHFYTDGIQIYMPLVSSDPNALTPLYDFIRDIKIWLAQNFLHLNENKTEYIFITPDPAAGVSSLSAPALKNLGVIFDTGFDFDKEIRAVVKTSFFHLKLLTKVKPFFS